MIELENINKIHFLGIGGIGMSALARYFKSKGKWVSGYDRTSSELTSQLEGEGMQVHYEDDPSLIPDDTDLVIYTPAIPADLKELDSCRRRGLKLRKRAEVLGEITDGKFTIAVAGTHGKTTITAMIAHILKLGGYPVSALVGGIVKNYGTNFITSGSDELMVVEADEYDRSFLYLHPDIAVISSMDADHLDVYHSREEMAASFQQFAMQIKDKGKLVTKNDITIALHPSIRRVDYALEERSDIFAANIQAAGGSHFFDMVTCEHQCRKVSLMVPGRHNIANALAAVAACMQMEVEREKIMEGLKSFQGVKRRFDMRKCRPGCVYIDDYAHHPKELEAFILSVREIFPDKKITGAFQPHLYTRTRDFAEGFAMALEMLDEIILLDIYPAREMPISGVTSRIILDLIDKENKMLLTKEKLLEKIRRDRPEVMLTMGAGDIDQLVIPIEKICSEE